MRPPQGGCDPPNMETGDARSVRFAAATLLAVSVVRWAVWGGSAGPATTGAGVLGALSEEESRAVAVAERANTPLAEDERIDPNRADVTELDRLPGVGATTALAIVSARESGAVFRVAEDLPEVPGIGLRTVDRLRPLLDLEEPLIPRIRQNGAVRPDASPIDVNRASAAELETLPGVGPVLADRIVDERRRGRFASLEDLTRVAGVGPATIDRLRGKAEVGRGS